MSAITATPNMINDMVKMIATECFRTVTPQVAERVANIVLEHADERDAMYRVTTMRLHKVLKMVLDTPELQVYS